jgi:predicted CoA-binding protein
MQRANGTASNNTQFLCYMEGMSIPAEVKTILNKYKKVVLIENGFEVFGVNPGLPHIEGIRVVASLKDVSDPLEIVDIYRSPDAIPAIVEELKTRNPAVVWLQPGAENPSAEEDARALGMKVISGRCIFADHKAMQ